MSAAKPKIADYHFTTITPNLGLVKVDEGSSFVMADIPGLIEGAADGAGLGHRFLRHTERTKVLIHVLDISGSEGRDPLDDFEKVNKELERYNENLIKRPMVIAANKMDIADGEDNLNALKEKYGDQYEIFPVSAVSGQGLKALVYRVWQLLEECPIEEEIVQEDEVKVTKVEAVPTEEKFTIRKGNDGIYYVEGPEIERHYRRTQFENEDSLNRFLQIMDAMGVVKALRKEGVQDGDTVNIGGLEFDFMD